MQKYGKFFSFQHNFSHLLKGSRLFADFFLSKSTYRPWEQWLSCPDRRHFSVDTQRVSGSWDRMYLKIDKAIKISYPPSVVYWKPFQ